MGHRGQGAEDTASFPALPEHFRELPLILLLVTAPYKEVVVELDSVGFFLTVLDCQGLD